MTHTFVTVAPQGTEEKPQRCAGVTKKKRPCRAHAQRGSPFCGLHEFQGVAECVGGGPLDGWCIYRSPWSGGDEISIAVTHSGMPVLVRQPACNLRRGVVRGTYRFTYLGPDLRPTWEWGR
jgi:hypothetical protein